MNLEGKMGWLPLCSVLAHSAGEGDCLLCLDVEGVCWCGALARKAAEVRGVVEPLGMASDGWEVR